MPAPIPPHNILSPFHLDTLTASVVRGDLLIGNSTPVWSRLAIGANNTFLKSDGTDISWAAAPTTSPGGSTTQVQYNSSSAFAGSANLVWDNTNGELQIGTASSAIPYHGLIFKNNQGTTSARCGIELNGVITYFFSKASSGANVNFAFYNENGGGDAFYIFGNGNLQINNGDNGSLLGIGFLKPHTTNGNSTRLQAYDVDGAAYKTFITLLNGNTPDCTIAAPSGGTITLQPTTYKSSDGTTGATAGPFTLITAIEVKNGLVTTLTGS